jgi:hypothetical protein
VIASIFSPQEPQRTDPGGFFAKPHDPQVTSFPKAIAEEATNKGERGQGPNGPASLVPRPLFLSGNSRADVLSGVWQARNDGRTDK